MRLRVYRYTVYNLASLIPLRSASFFSSGNSNRPIESWKEPQDHRRYNITYTVLVGEEGPVSHPVRTSSCVCNLTGVIIAR
jgi:hypothetical protein